MAIDRAATLRNAEKLLRQGKLEQAIAEYRSVVEDQPRDWTTANVLGDLYLRAGQSDRAVEQFTRIADNLNADGFLPKAAAVYKKIIKIKPDNEHALGQAGEIAAKQGLLVDARAYFNAIRQRQVARGDDTAAAATTVRLGSLDPADVPARVAGARARVSLGDINGAVTDLKTLASDLIEKKRLAEALAALNEAAALAPDDRSIKQMLAPILSQRGDPASLDQAQPIVLQLADDAAARGEWDAAADLLEGMLARAPHNLPILLRLVEVCVDGNLDARMNTAQMQLADAYLCAGAAAEARFIAEDLVARYPDEEAHRERLRLVLELMGEADPDAALAERLDVTTDVDFDAPDVLDDTTEAPPVEEVASPPAPPETPIERTVAEPSPPTAPAPAASPAPTPAPVPPPAPARVSEPAPERMHARIEHVERVEVDLSVVLDDIKRVEVPPPIVQKDIEGVFAQFRNEAGQRLSLDRAEQEFRKGMALYEAGNIEAAAPSLEAASRSPLYRFAAARTLGRIALARGQVRSAIDWLERAAEAPGSSAEDMHRLLLELADALESCGETARSLAVCLELQADAGDYEDVAARIDRLAKIQALG